MTISYLFRALKSVLSDWKLLRMLLWQKLYVQAYLPLVISHRQARYVAKLRKKDHVDVVFLPMNVAMWKYQHLYELLKNDSRFRVHIFLTPFADFANSQRIEDVQAMRVYFDERKIDYVDCEPEKDKPLVDIRSVVDPDIIFYTQPYATAFEENRKFTHFLDKLLCYVPYAYHPRTVTAFYKWPLHRIAWKLYYPTEYNKLYAMTVCKNKARNVVVSGYPGADDYLLPSSNDVWKIKDRHKKRVIWAPHFTVTEDVGFVHTSYFLEMASFMQELALEYANRITIAFKPHPRLFSQLCVHPAWGEEKAKEYYDFWENNENTQLETGEFVDLFKGSDAMIHDCGSFIVDYMYFGKPVLYDNPNIKEVKATADELGKQAYDAHYSVRNLSDIKAFIDDVVLGGNDPKAPVRKCFFDAYLRPKDGKTASQFIYDDIVKSIWG